MGGAFCEQYPPPQQPAAWPAWALASAEQEGGAESRRGGRPRPLPPPPAPARSHPGAEAPHWDHIRPQLTRHLGRSLRPKNRNTQGVPPGCLGPQRTGDRHRGLEHPPPPQDPGRQKLRETQKHPKRETKRRTQREGQRHQRPRCGKASKLEAQRGWGRVWGPSPKWGCHGTPAVSNVLFDFLLCKLPFAQERGTRTRQAQVPASPAGLTSILLCLHPIR